MDIKKKVGWQRIQSIGRMESMMGRMKTWKVTCERHNPQLGVFTVHRTIEAMTARSAVNKLNRKFEEEERRGAYGWNVAISAELA